MIAHVAEVGENSGRVVLHSAAGSRLAPGALAAALHVAHSFKAGLESLVSEDPGVLEFASFEFARQVHVSGGTPQPVTAEDLEMALQRSAVLHHGQVAAAAHDAGVPVHCRTLRNDPASAIAAACSENGPWNVAVLADAVSPLTQPHIKELFDCIADVTGIIVAGHGVKSTKGPVVAVIEQLAHVQPMLRAAERLAAGTGDDVHLILFGGNADDSAWMDGQIRLLLDRDADAGLILAPETFGSPDALAAILQDLGAGFVIAQLDGALLPPDDGLTQFAAVHDGPLFLVRR